MKNNIKIKNFLELFPYLIFIMIICFIFIPKISQNDLYFDLKSGENLLQYGLDFKDHFSFIPDLKYLYHHYLYDLIILMIFNLNGFSSIFSFFLILYTFLGFIVFYVNKQNTNKNSLSLIFTFVTLYLIRNFFGTRVQSISYIIFYLEIFMLDIIYKKGKLKYSIILIIMSILLVNLHMTVWIIYPILFLPYILEIIMYKINNKINISKFISKKIMFCKSNNLKLFIGTFIIVLITGLLSPYRFMPFIFFIKTAQNSNYSIISEMQRTIFINNLHYLILFFTTIIILLFCKSKINFRNICLFLGLFLLSLFANRHMSYFLLIMPTMIFKILNQDLEIYKFHLKINLNINKNIVKIVSSTLLIILYFMCLNVIDFKSFDYGENEMFPTETVKFIKNNLDYKNLKIYNGFDYGSFLAYKDIPVFIDSRAEVYMKNFNGGKDIIGDYIKINEYDRYEKILKKYEIEYLLVYKNSNIYKYITKDLNYELIYAEQDIYYLFKKV